MKKITVSISAPKCGASSDELRKVLADNLGAEFEMVGARLAILPADIKAEVAKAKKMVDETWKKNTLPWIGNERVCADGKVDLVIDEINSAVESATKKVEELKNSMKVWLPKVKKALGKGVDLVDLPTEETFVLKASVGSGDASSSGKGLPRDAGEAQVAGAIAKAEGYENLMGHLLNLAEKIEPGKAGNLSALRLKEDAATAAELGVVDKSQLKTLNKLTAALIAAGKAGGGVAKAKAKANLTSAIVGAGNEPSKGADSSKVVKKTTKGTKGKPATKGIKGKPATKGAKGKPATKGAKKTAKGTTISDKAMSLI